MSTTIKNTIGSAITAITGAALNAMANNAVVLGSAINWTQGQTADGYLMGRVELNFKFQVAPSAVGGLNLWFIKSVDGGSTYEDGTAAPPRPPDYTFSPGPFNGTMDTAAHRVSVDLSIPVGSFKTLLQNSGTGQALTANNTDNTLTITPITLQSV